MLTQNYIDFINAHAKEDPRALRLKYAGHANAGFDYGRAITQIECRRKFAGKLRETLARSEAFEFADSLSGEQSTSDRLARYHAGWIPNGATVIDMTAGLGIDAMHMASRAAHVTAIERDERRAQMLIENAAALGLENIEVLCGDSVEMLREGKLNVDIVMIDPARRDAAGGRVFALKDCEPDVTALLPELRKHFKTLLVKMSPMLDVTQTLRELPGCTDIMAVGTATECSELFACVNLLADKEIETDVHAITLLNDGSINDFACSLSDLNGAPASSAGSPTAGNILYEPWPTVMKTGAYRVVAQRFAVRKLENNTHLFFSEKEDAGFPGDMMRIDRVIPWQSKNIKRLKGEFPRLDVAVRNFGMTADQLRDKLGVKPGGDLRLYGVSTPAGKLLILTSRI